MSKIITIPENIAKRIRARQPFKDGFLIGYRTRGLSYIIASSGEQSDNGNPLDLLLILPADIGQGQVVQLWIAVAPELITEVERVLR